MGQTYQKKNMRSPASFMLAHTRILIPSLPPPIWPEGAKQEMGLGGVPWRESRRPFQGLSPHGIWIPPPPFQLDFRSYPQQKPHSCQNWGLGSAQSPHRRPSDPPQPNFPHGTPSKVYPNGKESNRALVVLVKSAPKYCEPCCGSPIERILFFGSNTAPIHPPGSTIRGQHCHLCRPQATMRRGTYLQKTPILTHAQNALAEAQVEASHLLMVGPEQVGVEAAPALDFDGLVPYV